MTLAKSNAPCNYDYSHPKATIKTSSLIIRKNWLKPSNTYKNINLAGIIIILTPMWRMSLHGGSPTSSRQICCLHDNYIIKLHISSSIQKWKPPRCRTYYYSHPNVTKKRLHGGSPVKAEIRHLRPSFSSRCDSGANYGMRGARLRWILRQGGEVLLHRRLLRQHPCLR